MAKVHVCNVVVLDNPSQFNNPFQFEITFECIEDLPEDLEWKIIYVGSAESEEFDQVCDNCSSFYGLIKRFHFTGSRHCLRGPSTWGPAHVRVSGLSNSNSMFEFDLFSKNTFRPTRPTLRRSPWQTWWGSRLSSSPAATDQQVSCWS